MEGSSASESGPPLPRADEVPSKSTVHAGQISASKGSRFPVSVIFPMFLTVLLLWISIQVFRLSSRHNEMEKTLAAIMSEISTTRQEVLSQTTAGMDSARDTIQQTISRECEDTRHDFQNAKKTIVDLLARDAGPANSSANVSSRQAAAALQATEKAQQARDEKSYSVALMYYINALNHDPGKSDIVAAISETALESGDQLLLERARSVLELAAYQVPAADVDAVLVHISEVQKRLSPPDITTRTEEELRTTTAAALARYDPSAVWTNRMLIAEGIAAAETTIDLIESAMTGEQVPETVSNLLVEVSDLRDRLGALQDVAALCDFVENNIAALRSQASAATPSLPTCESILTAANQVLAQLWGKRIDDLPQVMRNRIHGYPDSMSALVQEVRRKTSVAAYEEANRLIDSTLALKGPPYSPAIKRAQTNTVALQNLLSRISFDDFRKDILTKSSAIDRHIVALNASRYSAYQKWVLGRCEAVMSTWNDQWIVTKNDAKTLFAKHQISAIDHSLLAPEVSLVFNHMLQKFLGKLKGTEGFEIEKDMVVAAKKTLDDF